MQLEFFDVPSPCIGICQSDEKGYCLGCMRTRQERQGWLQFNSDEKQKVIKRCQQRKRRKQGLIKAKAIAVEPEQKQASLFDNDNVANGALEDSNDLDFGDFEL